MKAMETRVLMAVCILLCLLYAGVAAPGTATFYEPHKLITSDCPGVKEPGPMVAAASDSIWNDGALRGKKFNVMCLGPLSTEEKFPCKGSVIVTVVDRCASPQCENTLELSRLAFDKIVDPTLIKIIIDYKADEFAGFKGRSRKVFSRMGRMMERRQLIIPLDIKD